MSSSSYDEFFYQIRISESGNDYSVTNSFGFLGAYQFGEAALVDLGYVTNDGRPFDNVFNGTFTGKNGVHDTVDFLSSVEAQDAAATEWFALLWRYLRNFDLEFYDGQTLNGVEFTVSGMIAGAHLGGAGGVRSLIESGGFVDASDANGTAITDYVTRFGGFDVPVEFVTHHEWDNTIFGGAGEDALYGHAGEDDLYGGSSSDYLDGGEGNDLLFGDFSVDVTELLSDLGL